MESLLCNFISRLLGDWKNLWALPIPNNMKIFFWRLFRDCLPSRQRLHQKGVPCTSLCPHCEAAQKNN
uniref:Reverse transcriptase zinc-binding domain-containing protein n=1 Tax=Cajanus cajan TaxID=3821 RepID=A0A151TQ01_CAJCA|nr:hypothetical protein KK1_008303 [Cajanus cajan]